MADKETNPTNKIRKTIATRIRKFYQTERLINKCKANIRKANRLNNPSIVSHETNRLQDLFIMQNNNLNNIYNDINLFKTQIPHTDFVADTEIRLFREHDISLALEEMNVYNTHYEMQTTLLRELSGPEKNKMYNSVAQTGYGVLQININLNNLLKKYENDYGTENLMKIEGLPELKAEQSGEYFNEQSSLRQALKNAELTETETISSQTENQSPITHTNNPLGNPMNTNLPYENDAIVQKSETKLL